MTQEIEMTNKPSNAIVRKDFGGSQIQTVGETAAMAVAAQAKAAIEARWLVATHQPRNMEQVRQDLLRECQRPSFAEAAIYRKPIGAGIEGLSIRYVEQALQAMGNVDTEVVTIYDDPDKRIVEVRVTDFQRNVGHRKQLTITKLVERKYLKKGQVPVSQRQNSAGETTYLVHASEDDLITKEAALTSKAIRTCGLRMIPGWLQDECEEIIRKTKSDEAARDPDAEKRKLLDGFGAIGVTPSELEEYLGHPLSQIVPAEIVQLRDIWKTIQAQETTWVDTLAHRNHLRNSGKPQEAKSAAPAPAAAPAKSGAAAVKAAMVGKGKPPAPAPPPAPKVEAKVEDVDPGTLDNMADNTPAEKPKTAEEKGAAPGSKRPSRTKAAKAQREEEIQPWVVKGENDKVVRVYIDGGDPRNLAKAQSIHAKWKANQAPPAEEHPSPPSDEEIRAAFTETTEDGEPMNPETGEVLVTPVNEPPPIEESEEPAWMRGDAPPGEGF